MHHMRRIYNNKQPSCIWVFWAKTEFLPCLVSHIFVSIFFYWFEIVNPWFVTSNKIVLDWIWEAFFAIAKRFVLVSIFWSSVNIYGINLARLFNIRLKIKCSPIAICQQLWQYHKFCISNHFQLFPRLLRHLPCLLQSQVDQILLHLWWTLCQSEISFSTY